MGRSSQAFCELSGRVEGVVGDVVMSLVEMGINIDSLHSYSKRATRTSLYPLSTANQTPTPKILQAGQKKTPPPYIPSYMPSFPDPHAYIRTLTYKQPVTEYEAIREKAASQKRDVERALTRFIAKTGEIHTLFNEDDSSLFPLIACKPMPHPYLQALLPKDQIFDEDEAQKESPPRRQKPVDGSSQEETEEQLDQRKDELDPEGIDNPFLRPIKMPRKKRR